MKSFNAFQAVVLFAVWPFLIGWLAKAPFPYSVALFWVTIAAYIAGFVAMCVAVRIAIDPD